MKQIIRTLNGNITFNTDNLLNEFPKTSLKEQIMRNGLRDFFAKRLMESGMPSFNMGSMNSQDHQLRDKPTSGSFGTPDNSKENDDGYNSSYNKTPNKLPIDASQNNQTDGNLHTNGAMWDTNNNDVGDMDIKQMLKMLGQKGILDKMPENIADELKSAYQWQFNAMTKKDKFTCMSLVVNNLAKDPNFYKDLDQSIIDQPNAAEKKEEPIDNTKDIDFYGYDKSSEKEKLENDPDLWWPENEPVGARRNEENDEEYEHAIKKIHEYYLKLEKGEEII